MRIRIIPLLVRSRIDISVDRVFRAGWHIRKNRSPSAARL